MVRVHSKWDIVLKSQLNFCWEVYFYFSSHGDSPAYSMYHCKVTINSNKLSVMKPRRGFMTYRKSKLKKIIRWVILCPVKDIHQAQLHTGQCKRTGGCYNELVVAFYSTGGGVKGKKIYTCWLYYLFINLHLFYLWWHLAHRPPVTLQFMALPSNWWFNSWFGLQIQQSSGVLSWQVFFSSVTA